MQQIDRDRFRLSSGRVFEAVVGVIGIDVDRTDGNPADDVVYGGYDERLYLETLNDADDPPWTAEERAELAAFMIERWRKFAGLDRKPDYLAVASELLNPEDDGTCMSGTILTRGRLAEWLSEAYERGYRDSAKPPETK